jgi:ribonuclease R
MKIIKEDIAEFINKKLERPCTVRTMMRMLKIDERYRIQFQNVLISLVHEGALIKIKGNRYAPPSKIDLVIGRYHMHRDGSYGFVIPDDAGKTDVYVKTEDALRALPGDRVVVRIESFRPDAGPRGRIIRIIEEFLSSIVGKFERRDTYCVVVPFDRRLNQEVFIPDELENSAEDGMYVRAEITSRSRTNSMLVGKVVELIGQIENTGVDRIIVQNQFGIRTEFTKDVIREASIVSRKYNKPGQDGRADFRQQKAVTIDGEDARDFDDAVFLERADDGWNLYVHIADVSEFVKEGGKLDKEAYLRGCSVYFPETAVPMFPEQISNVACSLTPGVPHLAVTCKLSIDSTGSIREAEFSKSLIQSRARLTYNQVYKAISGVTIEIDEDILKMLTEMHALSLKLRKIRLKKGSVDFNFPEITVGMNDRGEITGIIRRETNDAHRIIEEFMIRANEAAASFLLHYNRPALFRIHEKPDPIKISGFLQIYRGLGYDYQLAKETVEPLDFARMLKKVKDSLYSQMLSRLMLRSMKIARYSPKNLGHFGLASDAYTHFTSPIRRYPDLMVHRELKKLLSDGKTKIKFKDFKNILYQGVEDRALVAAASHCSIKERSAEEAERELIRWRQVRFMGKMLGDVFDAVIQDVISYGIYVELSEYYLEGLIHVSSIYDDYYHYDERSKTLWGEKTHKRYSIGQTLKVIISKIDVEKRMIDFAPYGLDIRRKQKVTKYRRRNLIL